MLGEDWIIDGIEANRVLGFQRALSYHNETPSPSFPDGYSSGVGDGSQQVTPHRADYRDIAGVLGHDWIIDGIEANRVLGFQRALGYHVEPVSVSYPDGYGPGAE